MQAIKFLSVVLLTILSTVSSAAAASRPSATPPELFELGRAVTDKSAHPLASRALVPDAVEEYLINLDPATVAANPKVLLVNLPGLGTLEAVRTRFVDYRPDGKSWSGTLRRRGASGKGPDYIFLGYHGDRVTALIDFEGQRFRIAGGPGEGHRLLQLSDDLSPRSCAMSDPAGSMETPSSEKSLSQGQAPFTLEVPSMTESVTARIDVLVVYPKDFFTTANAAAEGALPTFVQDSLWLANDAFANSGIDAFYNLVGVVPLIGSSQPQTGLYSSLAWMDPRTTAQPTLASPQELTDLRNAFGADVVTLYIPFTWNANDYCGVANLPLANHPTTGAQRFYRGDVIISNAAMGDRAFSVNRYNCGQQDYTLGHEIAHNYGMHHHDVGIGDPWLYPYGRGKVLTFADSTKKATVMACECTGCFCTRSCALGSGAVCNRIPYFSDPNRTYNSVSLGSSDPADPRDNARVGRDNVGTYAAFRAQSANTPPNASFTVSCTGRTCTFNASGSTDNAAIPSGGYWWDFGDGVTGTGQTTSRTYTTAGSRRVHLVVKDAGGQTDVAWNTATTTVTYEGYHDVSSCASIHGWAWDGTPNDSINVDILRDGVLAATASANVFRSDLLAAGKGNGYHAFGYTPTNQWKDGVWHTSTVRFSANGTNLTSTPKNLICNVAIFTNTAPPTENLSTGGQVYTVATQFKSTQSGSITQLGFYRASGETGANTLRLLTDSGVELANVTPSCGASGWCWGSISPVAISANTNYRVSVNTNTQQSKTGCGIGSGITNGPLTALSGYWIAGTAFPTNGSCSNFYVDVKFDM
jgi:hypothetical protein